MSWRHVPINERSKVALLKANLISGDDTIAILVMPKLISTMFPNNRGLITDLLNQLT